MKRGGDARDPVTVSGGGDTVGFPGSPQGSFWRPVVLESNRTGSLVPCFSSRGPQLECKARETEDWGFDE